MRISPQHLHSLAAGLFTYFVLIFLEDLTGINRKQRLFLAIAVGFLFYHYGDVIVSFIKGLFGSLGL